MVDMAVGEQDLLDGDAGLADCLTQLRQVAAGIDEGAAHGHGAPDQAAILLQRGHRDNAEAKRRLTHWASSRVAMTGGSSFIEAATASAWRRTRRILPPASLARSA